MDPITAIGNAITAIIDRVIPDPAQAQQLKQQIVDSQAQVVIAEAKGESWIQRSWRPITMLSFVGIIVNNYLLYPYLSLFWHSAPSLPIPPDMWELLKIGIGGYIVSRGGEKMIKTWATK